MSSLVTKPSADLYYYSVQLETIYRISSTYLDYYHVYVTEKFDAHTNPPSSDPKTIHHDLRRASERKDKANSIIREKFDRFLKFVRSDEGATAFQTKQKEVEDIIEYLKHAHEGFRPCIFVIYKTDDLEDRCEEVLLEDKLVETSQEWIIPDLKAKEFDVIITALASK